MAVPIRFSLLFTMKKFALHPSRHVLLTFLATALSLLFAEYIHAAPASGTAIFQGIIQSESYNDEGFGFISLTLGRAGTFSMRFNVGVNQVGQHYYTKSGKFDANGHYHFEGKPVRDTRYEIPRIIDLQLDSTDSPTRITGMCTDLTHSSNFELEKLAGSSLGKEGAYTLVVSNDNDWAPTGSGTGHISIDRKGRIVASGHVPGGRTFSTTANLTVFNHWPVFATMAGTTNGVLSGFISFQNTAGTALNGQLTWIGPEVPGPNHAFVPRFVTDVSASGRRSAAQQ